MEGKMNEIPTPTSMRKARATNGFSQAICEAVWLAVMGGMTIYCSNKGATCGRPIGMWMAV